ncbi:MAG: NUDIX hydrolase [Chloroflexi bacterium]|nr:NUDIX hydrolase [Chloroflexota bacterium]
MRRQVSAGGVVLRRSDSSDLVALTMHKDLKGNAVWSLPKGIVESEETPEQAAVREVREETGLEGRIVSKLGTDRYWFFSHREGVRVHKTVHFFLMECVGGDTARHDWEVDEVRWFDFDSARKALSYEGERKLLDLVGKTCREEDLEGDCRS